MKIKLKFLGLILCLFLMIPSVNALTIEQVREELLADDIVINTQHYHSNMFSNEVGSILRTRMSNIDSVSTVYMGECTYSTCDIEIAYYNRDTSQYEYLTVEDVPFRKYGVVFANDDIIHNHVGETLTIDYKIYDDKFSEVASELDYVYSVGMVEENGDITIKDNKITFNKAGIYEIHMCMNVTDGSFYCPHIIVLTDTQNLIDQSLNKISSFISDRTKVSSEYTVIQALEENLKNQILSEHIYLDKKSTTAKVDGEESKYNVNFTLKVRDTVLTFSKSNLTVVEDGISFETPSYVKLNLTNNKTYQVDYVLYSANVNWTSSHPAVATVSSTGLVTAVASGASVITANLPSGNKKDFIVMVQDNGEKKAYLANILNGAFGANNEVYIPAISGFGSDLESEIYSVVYDAFEDANNDENVIMRVTDIDTDNYRFIKVRLGYEIVLDDSEDDYKYVEYCAFDEYDYGFDCATSELTVAIKYEDDKANFDNSILARANELAAMFNYNKFYVSDANKTLKTFIEDDESVFFKLFWQNANLDESIANNEGFTIIPTFGMVGWEYFPAELDYITAFVAKDNIMYQKATDNLKIKSVLKVQRPEGNETVIDAIVKTVRGLTNRNIAVSAVADKYTDGAYVITVDLGEDDGFAVSTYVELVDGEVNPGDNPGDEPQESITIRELNITGIVAPVEGEHPETANIRITTPGVTLKSAIWSEGKENGKELGAEDVFVVEGDSKYILRLMFDLEEGYEIENPEINSSAKAAMDDFVGCPPEQPCVQDIDVRLYYGVKSKEPVGITAVPHIDITNVNNAALKLDIAYDQNATYIEIYRATSKTGKYTKVANVEEGLYRDENLIYGTTYYYKVRVCNTVNCSAYSNIVSGKIVPNKVEGLNAITISTNQVKLGWTKFDNVTGYEVVRSTKADGKYTTVATTKNVNELTNAKLNGNTTYYYKVRAYKTVGKTKVYGAYSDAFAVKTAPVAPKISIAAGEYNSLKLTVTAVNGADAYEISRSNAKNGEYTKIATLEAAGSYIDEGIDTGKVYYYKARACAGELCGNYSGLVSKAPALKAPTFALSINENKKATITIDAVVGADGYEISRSLYKNKKFTVLGNTEELTYEADASLNKTYYYRVRAYRVIDEKKVYSSYSGVKYNKVTLGTPTIVLTKQDLNKVNIDITAVNGAVGYEIVRSTKKTRGFGIVGTVEGLNFNENIKLNATYYYKVRAYILVNGKKEYSKYSAVKSVKSVLGTPTYAIARAGLDTANININEVNYAEGYEIYRSTSKTKGYKTIATITDLAYLDTLTLNTTYYYKVRAFVMVGESKQYGGYSSVKSLKLTLATPTFAIERSALNKVNINITEVENAEGYEIYRSLYKNKKFALVSDTTELTYEDTLNFNTTYYYKVRAYVVRDGKKYYSNYTGLKTVKLGLNAPTLALTGQEGQVEVRIDEVTYAEGYEVYRATSKYGKFTKVGETTEGFYNDPGQVNKTYYYKVRAYATLNEKKVYSGYSAIKSAKVLPLSE